MRNMNLKIWGIWIMLALLTACISPGADTPTAESQPPQSLVTPTKTAPITQAAQETEKVDNPMENKSGNADVTFVRAIQDSNGTWSFHVTVSHPDTGWEDYADGWDILLEDGTVLKPDPSSPFTRLLLHPHVGEQPFTRSQNGIQIPAGAAIVIVRAHDILDGFGGVEISVDLTKSAGDGYSVERQP